MTVTGDPASSGERQPGAPVAPAPRLTPDLLAEVCPYLVAGDGSWQSAQAIRDQRCGAFEPSAPLTPAKQRSLCLVIAHLSCATYIAAHEHAASTGIARAGARDGEPNLWPVTRSRLIVLEPDRRLFAFGGSRVRVGGQVGLIALMVVAFLLLIVARTSSPSTPVGAIPSSSAIALLSPSPHPTPSPAASAAASAAPSATPRVTPKPTNGPNRQRYRVKAGDTLSEIAVKFGTTMRVLKRINDITDPTLIRPGQVILVPTR